MVFVRCRFMKRPGATYNNYNTVTVLTFNTIKENVRSKLIHIYIDNMTVHNY